MKESIVPPFHSLKKLWRLLSFSYNVQRSDSFLFSSADAAALPILEYISSVKVRRCVHISIHCRVTREGIKDTFKAKMSLCGTIQCVRM